MKILVFKTNIDTPKDVKIVSRVLKVCTKVRSWHVDIEDVDKVLRIEASGNNDNIIKQLVTRAGYLCTELT